MNKEKCTVLLFNLQRQQLLKNDLSIFVMIDQTFCINARLFISNAFLNSASLLLNFLMDWTLNFGYVLLII